MRPFLKKYRNLLIGLLLMIVVASAFIFVRRSNADPASEFQTAAVERGQGHGPQDGIESRSITTAGIDGYPQPFHAAR